MSPRGKLRGEFRDEKSTPEPRYSDMAYVCLFYSTRHHQCVACENMLNTTSRRSRKISTSSSRVSVPTRSRLMPPLPLTHACLSCLSRPRTRGTLEVHSRGEVHGARWHGKGAHGRLSRLCNTKSRTSRSSPSTEHAKHNTQHEKMLRTC